MQIELASRKPLVYKGTTLLLSAGFILYSGDTSLKILETIKAEAASVTYYETTSNLNLRAKNSTKSAILLTIPKGERVTYISKNGAWLNVKYKNRTGWINNQYVKKLTTNSSSSAIVSSYQTTANLNMRSKASTNGKILSTIPKGKTITYISKSGSWYKVKYNTTTGWVSSDYIKKVDEPNKQTPVAGNSSSYTTKANLNLRSSASTKGAILTTIPKGKTVMYVSKSGSWFKIKYGNKSGWVSSSYLIGTTSNQKESTPPSVEIPKQAVSYETTANLNLRSSASAKGTILITIPKGKTVTYVSKSGSWFKIKYGNKSGWVSSSYLKGTSLEPKENATPTLQTQKKVITYQTTANLNLRTEATTEGSVIMTIPKGSKVTYLSKSSFWYKVQFGSKTGWVSSDFLKEINEDKKEEVKKEEIYRTTANLNLRIAANKNSTLIKTIQKGEKVTYLSKNGSWFKVSYNSFTGWVSSQYLIKDTGEIDSSEQISSDSYITMDLRTKSSVTAAQINAYIARNATSANSALYNKGSIFINAANKYGVNALYLAAHAIHESNFGKSTISLAKNNLFGYGAYDAAPFVGAVKFHTIESNIEFIAQMMKATYLNEGYWSYKGAYLGSTVKDGNGNKIDNKSGGMNFYYASDSNWGKAIAKHMSSILDYSKEDAKGTTPNTFVPSKPSYPDAKDVFPAGTIAVAHTTISLISGEDSGLNVYKTTSNLNLRSKSIDGEILLTIPKGAAIIYISSSGSWYKVQYNGKTGWVSSQYVTKSSSGSTVNIKAGETFNLLEKHNNETLKVNYQGKVYYTSGISLSTYYKFMSVKNLARVNATSLHVRTAANTGSGIVVTLSNYQYIELAVDEKNNPITNNGWYKVKLSNGKQGWVSGLYIIRELNK